MIYKNICDDLKIAMKSGDKELRDYIKVVKAELQRGSKEPTDEECMKVLKKLKKNAEENSNQDEINYLDKHLPQMISKEEIETNVDVLIGQGVNNIGGIMKFFRENYPGRVDNKLVSQIAKEKLN
jgi:uncharacterized protein YqeY